MAGRAIQITNVRQRNINQTRDLRSFAFIPVEVSYAAVRMDAIERALTPTSLQFIGWHVNNKI